MGRPSPTPHVKRLMRRFGVSHKWRGLFGLDLDWSGAWIMCKHTAPSHPHPGTTFSHPHHPSFNYTITPLNIPAITYSGARQPTSMLAYSQGVEIPTKSLRWSLGRAPSWVCDFFLTPFNIIGEFVYGGGKGRINSLP